MLRGLVIAIVAILGLSIVQVGHMTGYYGDDNYKPWYEKFWDYFDYKKWTGFMSSGGSNDHDDDDDDDHDNPDQSPIESATIAFDVDIREIVADGEPAFQNVINECVFHSAKSFEPLCIKCKFLDKYGNVIATGEKIDLQSSYTASDQLSIPMTPVPEADPDELASNDVSDIEKVKLEICGFKCIPVFADFKNLKHGARQAAINGAMAAKGISVSGSGYNGLNEVIIFDADKTGTADTDLQVKNGLHLLILPETNTINDANNDGYIDSPNDAAAGGTITVKMETPFFLKSFVLVDHERDPAATAKAYDAKTGGNLIKSVILPITGDGKFTTVNMNAANVQRLEVTYADSGGITNIDLRCEPPKSEGCTPGFWKQDQHFKYWKTYKTTDKFGTIFGITSNVKIKVDNVEIKLKDATLLQALKAQGGGVNALARHAVAALLNAASGMNYAFTVTEVITMVKDAIQSGNSGTIELIKNKLEEANEKGCAFDKDCDCDDRKDHYYKYYDNHKKYSDDNKNKFKSSDYKNYMDEHKKYLNDYGKYMEKSDYKMHTDYFKKFLDDNKNKFSNSDYKKYSDDHKKYSNDYNNHHDNCKCDDDDGKDHHDKHDNDKNDKDYKYKYGKDHDD